MMFDVIPYKEAIDLVSKRLSHYDFYTESVNLLDSQHRILANDIFSPENVPAFERATVDGYAVKSSDTHGSSDSIPSILSYIGASEMGTACTLRISSGQAVYVPTGGMLPLGADAMVMIEYTEKINDEIFIYRPVHLHQNTVLVGEDTKKGQLLLRKGSQIKSSSIGVLSAIGCSKVDVYKKLNFAIISTGDEIVPVSESPCMGQVRDTNTPLLTALIQSSPYGKVVYTQLVNDGLDNFISAINHALSVADIVIVSGGSSVGEKDFTYTAFQKFSDDIFIKGLALKPGKPTIVAKVGKKLLFGLPGHPMAAVMTYKLIIDTALHKVFGAELPPKIKAKTMINFPSESGRATIIPVDLRYIDNEYQIYPLFSKSGLVSIIARAKGYVIIDENTEGVEAGSFLQVVLL